MKFKYLIPFFIFLGCSPATFNKTNDYNSKKSFSSQGFAYIFEENDFKEEIVSKNFENSKLTISHNFLKSGTSVKILNPENSKSIVLRIKKKSKYPNFYKILITKAVAEKLQLNYDVPFVEIQEIKKNKSFVASKAKIFEEEKKVHDKAPVTNVKISNISSSIKPKKLKIKKFSIIIAEFYNKESAIDLKNNLSKKLNTKKIVVKKSGKNKYKLISGPYNTVNLLKNDYIGLSNYGFEDLDIKLND